MRARGTSQRRRRGQRGQAVTETMIMMAFLLLMMFGLVHLCMLMSMKFMVDFSAFAAARTAMLGGDVDTAALEGMGYMRGWWSGGYVGLNQPYVEGPVDKTIRGKTRTGYRSTWASPFGMPVFVNPTPCGATNAQTCGVRLVGFSPYTSQPDVPEEGDNQ